MKLAILATFFIQEPVEVVLGYEAHLPGPSGHQDVKHYCYYVSLIQSLKRLLNIPEINKQVKHSVFFSSATSLTPFCLPRYFNPTGVVMV